MAVPTAAQCKLNLSFDMVAKTMTASVQSTISSQGVEGLEYYLSYAVITDPLGTTYDIDEITFDGDGGTGSQVFDAPVDEDGIVINGSYTITIGYVFVDDGVTPTWYTDVDSGFTLNYTANVVSISQVIKCSNPASFVSTDETVWNQYNPDNSTVTPAAGANYEHNLLYPVGSDGAGGYAPPTETSDISITRGPEEFFNGTQTSFVTRDLTWTFADGLIVTDTIHGTKPIWVDCDNQMCSVTCGLNKLYDTWQTNVVANATEAAKNWALLDKTISMASLGQFNINCGNPQKATEIAIKIKSMLGNCCDDCANNSGTPVTGY